MKKPIREFLLIDVGNSRLKWTTGGKLRPSRIAGDIATRDATSKWVSSLAKRYPGLPAVVACVVPKLLPLFRRAFRDRLVEVHASLPELVRIGNFRFHYPNPQEIGADRLAAAVAAHAWRKFPAIIVACGTATAFSVLDAKGRFCGGAIAPGLETQLAALIGATAQLPGTILKRPRRVLAKSTHDAIRAGVMLNFQGGVKEIIHQLGAALPGRKKPTIILTGGHARHLVKNLELPHELRPLLVFEGLLIIGSRLYMPAS